jgi:tripartite-type tricarboxylate transporter receptor subunit TctC
MTSPDPVTDLRAPAPARRGALRAIAVAALAAPLGAARGQAFPSRPITVIEPFAAGGSVDAMVRAICERASQALGQPMVVDARPGGGTRIGTDAIRRAPKDGHTIGVMVSASGVNIPALDPKAGYDPLADFTLLTLGFESYFAIVANPKHGWRTLGDLLAASRAKPDGVTFGSSGVGTSSHIWPAVFQTVTGTRWVHVPYKGEAQTMQDLIGGSVDVMFAGPGLVKPHVDAGRLTALAVTAPERHPLLPNLPTADEQGVRGFVSGGWVAFVAPAGIPAEATERLSRALRDAIATPEVRERLAQAGFAPRGLPADVFAAQLKRELEQVRETGRIAKIVLD